MRESKKHNGEEDNLPRKKKSREGAVILREIKYRQNVKKGEGRGHRSQQRHAE